MSCKFSRNDIRFLNIIYKIGGVMAVIPFYDFHKCALVAPTFSKIYGSIFLMLEILTTSWIIYIRNCSDDINFFAMTFKLLGTCDNLMLSMLKISLIVNACYINQNKWMELNNKFQFIDKKLRTRGSLEKHFLKNVYVQFALYNIFIWMCILHNVVVRTMIKGTPTLKLFVLYELNSYYDYFVQILICNIVLAFKARYSHINSQLSGLTLQPPSNFFKEIAKLYRLLGELVGWFNEIFGLALVFVIGRCVIKTLVALNFFTNTLKTIENPSEKENLVLTSVEQTILILVTISILILCCDAAKTESYSSVLLCYKLRENFEGSEQRELLELAQIFEKNAANFSAAGFFDVNRATLFGILSTITTYLIVTIQFNQT